jgi:hypothetical protein
MNREEAIEAIKEAYGNSEYTDEIIKALEQELCNDAISRQAAHNMVCSLSRWCVRSEDGKWNNVGLLYDDVQFGLDKLPSVTPMQKWIPVSERLPEKDDQYICTVKFKHENGYQDEETHAVEYIKAYGGWDMDRFFSECNPQLIAWMPLPEPLKGGDQE